MIYEFKIRYAMKFFHTFQSVEYSVKASHNGNEHCVMHTLITVRRIEASMIARKGCVG